MKTQLINISGKPLKFGASSVPEGGAFELASVDAREFIEAGLAKAATPFEVQQAIAATAGDAPASPARPAPKAKV